jgi:peptidoglycan/xylan/chitin deacetylase (PgdA/CDA1 family)
VSLPRLSLFVAITLSGGLLLNNVIRPAHLERGQPQDAGTQVLLSPSANRASSQNLRLNTQRGEVYFRPQSVQSLMTLVGPLSMNTSRVTTPPLPGTPVQSLEAEISAPPATMPTLPKTHMAPPAPPPTTPPVVVPDGQDRVLKVPILMYHYLSTPPADADRYRQDLSVAPESFRTHLTWLRESGYVPITLRELGYALASGHALPKKPIVLTFDDGYADNYANAFPLLQEFGMRATFFVVTKAVEERNLSYMHWEQLVEMQQAGMEIASHTRSHPQLPGQPEAFIREELRSSFELLTQRLGQPPTSFAYPSGRFDPGVVHLTYEAGYQVAVTTEQGATHSSSNMLTLKRIRVRNTHGSDDLDRFINYWMSQD